MESNKKVHLIASF